MTTEQWLSLLESLLEWTRDVCLWISGGCTAAWVVIQLVGGTK